jgi:hypothetical protein
VIFESFFKASPLRVSKVAIAGESTLMLMSKFFALIGRKLKEQKVDIITKTPLNLIN